VSVWVDAATAAGLVITALGGGAGVRALARRRKPRTNADVAVALSAGTIRWAEKLEEQTVRLVARVEAAERKADMADQRADAASRSAQRIEGQLGQVLSYMDTLLEAIDDSDGRTQDQQLAHIRRIAARRPAILKKGQS
jgi:divalent metal cation (Fe/Co/Zn/Cd) transporter